MANPCQHDNTTLVSANEIMLKKCNNCNDSIYGVGSCVQCNVCKCFLHQICAKPRETSTHPFYPNVQFKLMRHKSYSPNEEPRFKHRCVACYQLNITGYHYVGDSQTYIHPYCLHSLKESAEKATVILHEEELNKYVHTTHLKMDCGMGLSENVKCIICDKIDTPGRHEFGWVYKYSYQSSAKKFECHIGCLRAKIINAGLNQICVKKKNPETSRASYFLKLPTDNWERSLLTLTKLTSPAVAVVLDMMISAFVGVPVVSIFLSIAVNSVRKRN